MRAELWHQVAVVAGRQYGLVTRAQVLTYLSRGQLDRRISSGFLEPVGRGVWRMAGTPVTWRQRALAAGLAVGPPVAVSHTSAGRLWRLDGVAGTGPIHVTVPPGRSGRHPGLVVHHHRLPEADLTERLAIPVTTVRRTLADLAGVVSAEVLSTATDDAMRRRILHEGDLRRLQAVRSRVLAEVVGRRLETPSGGSPWEDRVYGWIIDAGLPAPVRQHRVVLPTRTFDLDMAYPEERVGIEFDGFEWHKDRGRFDRDRARYSELTAAGWRMVIITSAHTEHEVLDRIRRTLEAARSG